MVDYTMPLEHFAFPDRRDRIRHEREGSDDALATSTRIVAVGRMAIDPIGYPYVIRMIADAGVEEIAFANADGRIAGRPGQYVANRGDGDERASAPVARHVGHGHG